MKEEGGRRKNERRTKSEVREGKGSRDRGIEWREGE